MADSISIAPIRGLGQRSTGDESQQKPSRLGLWPLYLALALQFSGALLFGVQLWTETQGFAPGTIPPGFRDAIQMLAGISLAVGVFTSIFFLRHSLERMAEMGRQIDVASGNFQDHLTDTFKEWDLSPSEQAVAIYAMKGFSNAEVAKLRGTSASTVKSQMNAIFRKSGFQNRPQLISFLVEELLSGIALPEPSAGANDQKAKSAS